MQSTSVNRRRTQKQLLPSTSDRLPSLSLQPQPSSDFSYRSNTVLPVSPSTSDFSDKLLQRFLDSTTNASAPSVLIDTSNIPISSIDQYMPNTFDFQQHQAAAYPLNLQDPVDNLPEWSTVGGGNMNGVANPIQSTNRGSFTHQRDPSTSSIGSSGSASPYHQSHKTGRGRVTDQASRKPSNFRHGYSGSQSSIKNHLPTPSQTPTHEHFLAPSSSNLRQQRRSVDSTSSASQRLNLALSNTAEDLPSMSYSGARQSLSSAGQEPITPITSGIYDQNVSSTQNGKNLLEPESCDLYLRDDSDGALGSMVPKLERTVTDDAYVNELYNPPTINDNQPQSNSVYLTPHTNAMMSERLQAAQMARSISSASSQSRGLSPFRPESPYVHGAQFNTSARIRQQQKDRDDAQELSYQVSPHTDSEPKTISPQEAMLDYQPADDETPLFPPTSENYGSYTTAALRSAQQSQFTPSATMNYGNINTSNNQDWNVEMPVALSSAPMQTYSSFLAPAMPTNPYLANFPATEVMPQTPKSASRRSDQTPDFPAHLTSMESSASEAPPSSGASTGKTVEFDEKPDSSASTGTYSCTYAGCVHRFSTSQKLQKHKRDAHRNVPSITPGIGSGMSTAQLLERNSQTGPHRCDRINPTTGKPCTTIFSRPYDLTRHEDTIHNIRKQKVRCALCQEEKTFSRSDALTRHMRVVHPDVDFPGKHRRRGGASD
jgi:hypothetical protein